MTPFAELSGPGIAVWAIWAAVCILIGALAHRHGTSAVAWATIAVLVSPLFSAVCLWMFLRWGRAPRKG